jgi:hypothetical protein
MGRTQANKVFLFIKDNARFFYAKNRTGTQKSWKRTAIKTATNFRLFLRLGEPRQVLFKQETWQKIVGGIWRFTADNHEAVIFGSR